MILKGNTTLFEFEFEINFGLFDHFGKKDPFLLHLSHIAIEQSQLPNSIKRVIAVTFVNLFLPFLF